MDMIKSKVIKMLGISMLDKEIAENVLELCSIYPINKEKSLYDGEKICRFYAKAATFFKEYLPEYYVSDLLGINTDDLQSLNIG